jgi:DNA-binding XRE family transcriptional regulator
MEHLRILRLVTKTTLEVYDDSPHAVRMGIHAVGAYLAALRESRGLSQQRLADMIGHSKRQVIRWEQGKETPSALHLHLFVAAVRGSIIQVHQLLINPNATVDDGYTDAAVWASQALPPEPGVDQVGRILAMAGSLTNAERLDLIARLAAMQLE